MRNAQEVLEQYFPEMRWRCLSLAADLDRVQRAEGGTAASQEKRLMKLQEALQVLLTDAPDRAERVQMIFSDMTPPPAK